ncbi:MAG: crossover junction endodeoxyribonuclease RuvC [Gemmatimonadota bacterium]
MVTRVLGVDPGSRVTGYGVVEARDGALRCVDCGTISGGDRPLPDRLVAVYDGLQAVVETYHPAVVAIENAFLGRNVKAMAVMSQTRGVLVLAARRAELPVFEYAPREIKRAVVGTGRASKAQIAYMVGSLLDLAERGLPRDATDSLAVALCHFHRSSPNGVPA